MTKAERDLLIAVANGMGALLEKQFAIVMSGSSIEVSTRQALKGIGDALTEIERESRGQRVP